MTSSSEHGPILSSEDAIEEWQERSLAPVTSVSSAAKGIPDVTARRRLTTRMGNQTQSDKCS